MKTTKPFNQRVLELIICPDCQKELVPLPPDNLLCFDCNKHFVIKENVIHFGDSPPNLTAKNFGYSWKTFSHSLPEIYEKQFLDWIHPITKDFFKDKTILDAGCGKGRHLLCAGQFGAKQVIGVDLSEAAYLAAKTTEHLNHVQVIRGDLYHLPLKAEFDYIYSIGVLHHLPDPKKGFLSLVQKLKPGGTISAWVYGKENNDWITNYLNPLRKNVFSQIPFPLLRGISAGMAGTLYSGLKALYSPARENPALKKRLPYSDYLCYISPFPYKEISSIVFDHLVAPIAFYISKEEFESWFQEAGLVNVTIQWHNQNSWKGSGEKPLNQ